MKLLKIITYNSKGEKQRNQSTFTREDVDITRNSSRFCDEQSHTGNKPNPKPIKIKVFPLTLPFVTAQQAKLFPLQTVCYKIFSVSLHVFPLFLIKSFSNIMLIFKKKKKRETLHKYTIKPEVIFLK